MAHLRRLTFSVTTDSSGDATVYSDTSVNGRVLSVQYVKTDFDNGVDFDLTGETSGAVIWAQDNVNASQTVYPRVAVHDTAGAGVTYDGTNEIYEPAAIAGERLELVVASGGDTKTGVVYVIVEGGG